MTGIFGFNVLAVQDRGKLYAHAHALNPRAMLFYSYMGGTAQEFAASFPDCATILRTWPDGEIHKQYTPEAWLNKVSGGIPENIYLYTSNEAGWTAELIQWHVALMKLAIQRKRRLCILNMGAGQPQPDDWKSARELVTLASQHPDLFIIGLHQYAGGVITSGLIGGDPTHILPAQWPTPAETRGMTRWHVGRQKFLFDYCKVWGIPPPRVVMTEGGFDDLSDIGKWLNTLLRTPPNTSINGWQTLILQWRAWWPNWDAETAYAQQMIWAADTLWSDVEAVLLFGWGDSGGWSAYDVSKAETFLTQLEAYKPLPLPVTPPVVVPPTPTLPFVPVPAGLHNPEPVRITGATKYLLQAAPSLDANCYVGYLSSGEQVDMYRETHTVVDSKTWHWVERTSTPLGQSKYGWTDAPLPPPIVVVDPTPTPLTAYQRIAAHLRAIADILDAIEQAAA